MDEKMLLSTKIFSANLIIFQLNIDPVLDMSPDHSESREETLCNAETLYNLLTVACTYLGQFDLLSMV